MGNDGCQRESSLKEPDLLKTSGWVDERLCKVSLASVFLMLINKLIKYHNVNIIPHHGSTDLPLVVCRHPKNASRYGSAFRTK